MVAVFGSGRLPEAKPNGSRRAPTSQIIAALRRDALTVSTQPSTIEAMC